MIDLLILDGKKLSLRIRMIGKRLMRSLRPNKMGCLILNLWPIYLTHVCTLILKHMTLLYVLNNWYQSQYHILSLSHERGDLDKSESHYGVERATRVRVRVVTKCGKGYLTRVKVATSGNDYINERLE